MYPTNLSTGKIRGLSTTSTSKDIFAILALDHRQSFMKMVNPNNPDDVSPEDVLAIKSSIVKSLGNASSAVLLDPVYSAAQTIHNFSLHARTGLLVALEETGYSGTSTERESSILKEWSAAKIKRMGADGVKLLIYYHPELKALAEHQEELVSKIVEECRRLDIAFFLEPVIYSNHPDFGKNSNEFATRRKEIILKTAHRLSRLDPDVLKIEFPVDPKYQTNEDEWFKACQSLTQASTCPWTVLSAGVSFETFARQVEIACRAGASGFIGGRAIWKESIGLDEPERSNWVRETGVKRMKMLSRIAEMNGNPWRDYLPEPGQILSENWYKNYQQF
jgi:tagatose 1,6-diphosphate aldolase